MTLPELCPASPADDAPSQGRGIGHRGGHRNACTVGPSRGPSEGVCTCYRTAACAGKKRPHQLLRGGRTEHSSAEFPRTVGRAECSRAWSAFKAALISLLPEFQRHSFAQTAGSRYRDLAAMQRPFGHFPRPMLLPPRHSSGGRYSDDAHLLTHDRARSIIIRAPKLTAPEAARP